MPIYFSLGESEALALLHLKQSLKTVKVENTTDKLDIVTCLLPPAELVSVLNIDVYADGQVKLSPEKSRSLVSDILVFCKLRKWNKQYLKCKLGKWTLAFLLRRLLLSVSEKVKAKHINLERFRPATSDRMELRMIVLLVVLIRADMTVLLKDFVVCTDACNYGGTVVYTAHEEEHSLQLLHSYFKNRVNWVKQQSWSVAIKHKRRKSQHIHLLEEESIVLSIRRGLKKARTIEKRLYISPKAKQSKARVKRVAAFSHRYIMCVDGS